MSEWLKKTKQDWTFKISLATTEGGDDNGDDDDDVVVSVPQHLRDSFTKNGFVVFPSVLSQSDVNELNDRLEEILRGNYDRGLKPDKTPRLLKNTYNKASDTKPLGFSGNYQNVRVMQVINVHKADKLFRQLACNKVLGKIVSELGCWLDVGTRLAQDQIWAKPPNAPNLSYHRDTPYFMFHPNHVITVWVALDNMDEELGPLEYVVGSHKWSGRVGSSNQFFDPDGGKSLLKSAAQNEGISENQLQFVSMAGLPAGSVSVHDGKFIKKIRQTKSIYFLKAKEEKRLFNKRTSY